MEGQWGKMSEIDQLDAILEKITSIKKWIILALLSAVFLSAIAYGGLSLFPQKTRLYQAEIVISFEDGNSSLPVIFDSVAFNRENIIQAIRAYGGVDQFRALTASLESRVENQKLTLSIKHQNRMKALGYVTYLSLQAERSLVRDLDLENRIDVSYAKITDIIVLKSERVGLINLLQFTMILFPLMLLMIFELLHEYQKDGNKVSLTSFSGINRLLKYIFKEFFIQ